MLSGGTAIAGSYQYTKNGKTLVWLDDDKPGIEVSWSGKRDADGYATGYGTLTWYVPSDTLETGSNVPRTRYRISKRVSGTMAQGKFTEVSPQGSAQPVAEPSKPKKRGWFSFLRPPRRSTPAPVEATPTPRPKSPSTRSAETAEKPTPRSTNASSNPTPTPKPSSTAPNDSLDSLMQAPSSLKLNSPAASPSPAVPSQTGTPDASMQLTPSPSPSESPE